ncbi:hypothetical protein HMPREF1617_05096 [Escherichia coli 908675]|nr:hypothetical protein ECOK1_1411 [Escherichia coli IHE3034]AJB39678.1 hypothetical protein L282_4745 [Escherichia coli APEC IMT5155]EFU48049.1 hypothetical protein HMPREF9539_01388 [Escherichia coli MS 110-3]EHG01490.1 hypothetical protein i01_01667 [Escherichia coli cloneA_i1]ESE09192.1 hypothetical protein HMPREF1617_05096 [Escherichia coli 908675]
MLAFRRGQTAESGERVNICVAKYIKIDLNHINQDFQCNF